MRKLFSLLFIVFIFFFLLRNANKGSGYTYQRDGLIITIIDENHDGKADKVCTRKCRKKFPIGITYITPPTEEEKRLFSKHRPIKY